MLIRMKSTRHGSRDGATTERFAAGTTHDLGHTPREADLVGVFLREGWAEKVATLEAPPGEAPPSRSVYGKRR